MSSKYKLTLAYDGTCYGGWQVQPNATTIQQLVQEALSTVLGEQIGITGSGRTDSGVHALAQVAHFTSANSLDARKLIYSLNGILPQDIRILQLEEVDEHFHARYSATGKIYRYHLQLIPDPFKRLYSYLLPYRIHLPDLEQAASFFIGTHDFSSFSNEADRGSAKINPVRTIHRIDIVENRESILLEFEGNGFLYKMVRNIVGTMVDVARGKIPLEEIPEILAAKDRRKGGTTAPAHGLFLAKVHYNEKDLGIDGMEE